MRILKTGCGNTEEAFIENRLTDGVNIIFSNDNNKGILVSPVRLLSNRHPCRWFVLLFLFHFLRFLPTFLLTLL